MARIKGDKPYGLQFESTVQADLDARKEIPLLADLTSANTWTALNGAPNHYVGMTTFCLENKTRYELLGDDPTDIGNWRVMGGGSNTAYDFKASDYVTDKSNATAGLQAMFDAVAKGELKMPNVLIEAGDYYCDNNLTLRHDCNIQGLGAALLFEDCPDSITGYHLHIYPSASTETLVLAENAPAGTKTIIVTDLGASQIGDIITIQNNNEGSFIQDANGKQYKQGEMMEIDSIDVATNTITLKSSLLASYTTDACNLRIQPKITVNITGLEVVAKDTGVESSPAAIRVTYGYNCTFYNLLLSGSCSAHLTLRNSYKCLIDNIKVDYKSKAFVGLNYAVQINSCYFIDIKNCFLKTTRHGITIGSFEGVNTVINRYINYDGNTVGTYELIALDFHSDSEYVTMRDNTITGSISLRGTKMVIRDNYISNDDNPVDPSLSIFNLNSSDISIIDNYIVTHNYKPRTTYNGVFNINSDVPLEYNEEALIIRGNKIINFDVDSTSTTLMLLRILPNDDGSYTNILNNVIISNNSFYAASTATTHSVDVRNGIENIKFNDNIVNRGVIIQYLAEHLNTAILSNNTFRKGSTYSVEARGTNLNLYIENNKVEGVGACAFLTNGVPEVSLKGNIINQPCLDKGTGTINKTAFCYINNAQTLTIDSNSLLNGVDGDIDQLFHLNNITLVKVGINTSNLKKGDILNTITKIQGLSQISVDDVIAGNSASNYQGAMVWDDANKRYLYRVNDEYVPASAGLAVYTTSVLPAVASAGNMIYWDYATSTALFSDGENWINAFGKMAARNVGYTSQRPTNLRTLASGGSDAYKDLGFTYFDRDLSKTIIWNGAAFMDANNQTPVSRMYGSDSVQNNLESTLSTVDRCRFFYKETWSQFLIWEGTRFVSAVDGKTPRRYFEGTTARRPAISGGDYNIALIASDVGMQFHDTTVDKTLILQTNSAGTLEWLDQNGRTPYKDSGYSRPTNLISYSAGGGADSRDLGAQFFDLTLGRPIWWTLDGKWVDATGAEV